MPNSHLSKNLVDNQSRHPTLVAKAVLRIFNLFVFGFAVFHSGKIPSIFLPARKTSSDEILDLVALVLFIRVFLVLGCALLFFFQRHEYRNEFRIYLERCTRRRLPVETINWVDRVWSITISTMLALLAILAFLYQGRSHSAIFSTSLECIAVGVVVIASCVFVVGPLVPLPRRLRHHLETDPVHAQKKSPHRLMDHVYRSTSVPFALIVVTMGTVLVFAGGSSCFRSGHHGFLSAHGMALAVHLSPQHNFLMFNRVGKGTNGELLYDVYNRFPVGAFAATKLAISAFPNNLKMQLSAARMLMSVFFVAAILSAFFAMRRLLQSSWRAVIATVLAFSSYYCLFYRDMVFNDVPTLFGLLLTFHGMVVFVQERRFTQLVFKTGASILLGWQVLALVFPFAALGCGRELSRSWSVRSILRSPYFSLGVLSGSFAVVILTANFLVEFLALNVPLTDIPTFKSMLWRFGMAPAGAYKEVAPYINWPDFLHQQFQRLGVMSVPYVFLRSMGSSTVMAKIGLGVMAISSAASILGRQKVLLVTLLFSGVCWAFPMRFFVAFHEFQSIFWIGVPLVFFSVLSWFPEKASRNAVVGFAVAAIAVFFFSIGTLKSSSATPISNEKSVLTTDFQRIVNQIGSDHTVFVCDDFQEIGVPLNAVSFFLAKSFLQSERENAEYILSTVRNTDAVLLTPKNEKIFLFRAHSVNSSAGEKKN